MSCKKVGIMGGTFDPFHTGHLQVASAAYKELSLDRIEFVPSAAPPHKKGRTDASYEHRINMVRLGCDESSKYYCNEIEGKLPSPSYSIDTLKVLQKNFSKSWCLTFIIGIDAFLDIKMWKSYTDLLAFVDIVISPRVGYRMELLYQFLEDLGYRKCEDHWIAVMGGKKIYTLNVTPQAISSSLIKKEIFNGGSVNEMVPLSINRYMKDNCLYI